MDCGGQFPPYVMDFDHRPGEQKAYAVSEMVSRMVRWEKIEAEVAKCDLVCSNCHRVRTFNRENEIENLPPSAGMKVDLERLLPPVVGPWRGRRCPLPGALGPSCARCKSPCHLAGKWGTYY